MRKIISCRRYTWLCITLPVCIALLLADRVHPCTSFFLRNNDQMIVGKNYDWYIGTGYIMINKAGVSKTAFHNMQGGKDQWAVWTSHYGSLTFNQFGREAPVGGINEAGLVVEMMMLEESRYPQPDSRAALMCLQWIQYHLDNYRTVQDVIASDARVRIYYTEQPGVHYLVCDKSGECAGIEFLQGKMVVHTRGNLPVRVLTNSTYDESMEFLNDDHGFGNREAALQGTSSLVRFSKAAIMLRKYDRKKSPSLITYGFEVLGTVAQSSFTQWRIIYDIPHLKVYFRTSVSPGIKSVDLHQFDLSCKTPVKILDMNGSRAGDVSRSFSDYTRELNYALVKQAFDVYIVRSQMSDDYLHYRSQYPESTVCVQ